MFTFASDYRTILFILGLLPSVIVNLSTSYSKDKFNDGAALERTIPGSEYQLESPLFDRHQDEEDVNNVILDDDERYQLIGASSLRSKRPGSEFVTRKNLNQSKIPGDNQHWLNKLLGKSWKHKRVAFEQDSFPKKPQPLGDDPFTKDADKMVPMASSNDDYRSGHFFDSYGDWHHHGGNGGGGGNGAGGGSDLADHPGGHYHHHHPVTATSTNGHGYSLAGLNLLNPLILVATLSFIISLINAVLGVVDKIRLPVVRARGGSSMGLSRLVDEGFLDELDDVLDEWHKTQKKGSQS